MYLSAIIPTMPGITNDAIPNVVKIFPICMPSKCNSPPK